MMETESSREACSIALTETDRRDGAEDLLERILDRNNLNKAYLKVKRNGGSAGVDEMTVDGMLPYLKEHREELLTALRNGWYKPQAVRRVEIPKPDGGVRKLGVPTVIDRMIQQAIVQVLQPMYEPLFSDSSYGFRPKRSAHQAISKAARSAVPIRQSVRRWNTMNRVALLLPPSFPRLLLFGPSRKKFFFGTMTSADFLQPSRTLLHGFDGCQSFCPSSQLQDLPS